MPAAALAALFALDEATLLAMSQVEEHPAGGSIAGSQQHYMALKYAVIFGGLLPCLAALVVYQTQERCCLKIPTALRRRHPMSRYPSYNLDAAAGGATAGAGQLEKPGMGAAAAAGEYPWAGDTKHYAAKYAEGTPKHLEAAAIGRRVAASKKPPLAADSGLGLPASAAATAACPGSPPPVPRLVESSEGGQFEPRPVRRPASPSDDMDMHARPGSAGVAGRETAAGGGRPGFAGVTAARQRPMSASAAEMSRRRPSPGSVGRIIGRKKNQLAPLQGPAAQQPRPGEVPRRFGSSLSLDTDPITPPRGESGDKESRLLLLPVGGGSRKVPETPSRPMPGTIAEAPAEG
eukprot:SAG22_NODE_2326_length_2710_cov_4.944849_2_plen_348_part_00